MNFFKPKAVLAALLVVAFNAHAQHLERGQTLSFDVSLQLDEAYDPSTTVNTLLLHVFAERPVEGTIMTSSLYEAGRFVGTLSSPFQSWSAFHAWTHPSSWYGDLPRLDIDSPGLLKGVFVGSVELSFSEAVDITSYGVGAGFALSRVVLPVEGVSVEMGVATISAVPEPSMAMMLALGVPALARIMARRRCFLDRGNEHALQG